MSPGAVRIAIAAIATVNLAIGLFAAIAPGSFYDEVGTYGAKNGHFVGDVGAPYIAVGAGLLVAVWRGSWRVPLLAVAAAWWALHAVNHLGDVDEASSRAKGIVDTILIALGAVATGYVGWVCSRVESASRRSDRRRGPGPTAVER